MQTKYQSLSPSLSEGEGDKNLYERLWIVLHAEAQSLIH
jgi:hypothetical protein